MESVPLPERDLWFYSRYFIVPKKEWGLHPIIDLKGLDRTLWTYRLKMLTLKFSCVANPVREMVCDKSKGCLLSLKILPEHRKFLRFAFRGSFQASSIPKHLYQVHGWCSGCF